MRERSSAGTRVCSTVCHSAAKTASEAPAAAAPNTIRPIGAALASNIRGAIQSPIASVPASSGRPGRQQKASSPPASSPSPIAVRIAAQAAEPPSESAATVGPRTKKGAKTSAFSAPTSSTTTQAQLRRRNSAQPSIRSDSSEVARAGPASGSRRPTSRAALTRKLRASTANAQPGLLAASATVASAGPATPPAEVTIPRSALASWRDSDGTTSGISAVIAGMKKAMPAPSATSATNSCQKAALPESSRIAMPACARKRTRSAPTRVERRESRSPIMPPTRRMSPKAAA
jgi:hypothetical protein